MVKKILLGEDNPIEADFIKYLLEDYTYINLDHFLNGSQLMEHLKEHELLYDLVIMDIKMPDISGIDIVKHIRGMGNICPIIILSTSNHTNDINDSYDAGVNSYLVKPIDFKQFKEMFHNVIMYWLKYNQPCIRREINV